MINIDEKYIFGNLKLLIFVIGRGEEGGGGG